MTARLRFRLLRMVVKWYVQNYQFETVLSVFWSEFRAWYTEDNLPSAMATVTETLEECEEARK